MQIYDIQIFRNRRPLNQFNFTAVFIARELRTESHNVHSHSLLLHLHPFRQSSVPNDWRQTFVPTTKIDNAEDDDTDRVKPTEQICYHQPWNEELIFHNGVHQHRSWNWGHRLEVGNDQTQSSRTKLTSLANSLGNISIIYNSNDRILKLVCTTTSSIIILVVHPIALDRFLIAGLDALTFYSLSSHKKLCRSNI